MAFSPLCTSPRHVSSPRASAFARGLCCGPAPLRTLPPPHPRPDACPFWGEAGTQALDSALSRGARVWGRMASSRGASVLPLSTQPAGTAVPAAGQGHRSGRGTRCLCKGPVSGPSLPPGLTRGSGAAEGGHLSLSLPYLPSSAAKGWLWARSAARQARAGEGRGRGVPPAAPSTTAGGGVATGPRAICLLLLPQGRWPSQREVRVDSLHIRGTVPGPRWLILAPGSHSDPGKLLL